MKKYENQTATEQFGLISHELKETEDCIDAPDKPPLIKLDVIAYFIQAEANEVTVLAGCNQPDNLLIHLEKIHIACEKFNQISKTLAAEYSKIDQKSSHFEFTPRDLKFIAEDEFFNNLKQWVINLTTVTALARYAIRTAKLGAICTANADLTVLSTNVYPYLEFCKHKIKGRSFGINALKFRRKECMGICNEWLMD